MAQIIGLNLWAWHQRQAVEGKQIAMQSLVKQTFPNVNPQDVLRDPDAVMRRETQALRTLAGKPGDADLESMLQAAASAWPEDKPAVESLRFEPGRLSLSAAGWSEEQVARFASLLRPNGWAVQMAEGRLTLSRERSGGRS
ncbi:MAG: GspL/Epsl periplasmic domain-containing protein [Betaproteobacteria bacterium]